MENKVLQYLKNQVKKEKLPDLDNMDINELREFIKVNFDLENLLTSFIRCIYMAIQQTYYDNYSTDNLKDYFNILEGTVEYNLETGQYLLKPNNFLISILEKSEKEDNTELKKKLDNRFYKMVKYLYLVEAKGMNFKNK